MSAAKPHALVVLGPTSAPQPALERAAWFAERAGASLELFWCDYDQELAELDLFDSSAREIARSRLIGAHLRKLRDQARGLGARGIDVRVDARWDHPLDAAVVRKTLECRADFVFKSIDHDDGLKRSLFSNADWNLLRSCPANLWLAKPRAPAERTSIVAAVDPMRADDRPSFDDCILDTAVELRSAFGGGLAVFHAYDLSAALAISSDSLMRPISAPVRETATKLRRRHEESVARLAARHGSARLDLRVHEGPVARMLTALCEDAGAGLVVMGAVSRAGLPRTFIGSTAERVLDRLPCDVLAIPPPGMLAACRTASATPGS